MGNKNQSVFVAIAAYRYIDLFTCQSLIALVSEQLTRGEFGMTIRFHVGECPIGRARNDLTHEFLKSDCTHLLFIDSDIIFSYEQVKKILFDGEDIVGGFYTKKQEGNVAPVCNSLNIIDRPNERGLVQVKYMGTGFLCIARQVFEAMAQEMGTELAYTDDRDWKTTKYDFWRMGVSKDVATGIPRWLSEDWQFCQFAIQCGFKVWADASILLQHSGMAVYPLSYQVRQLYTSDQLNRMGIKLSSDSQTGSDVVSGTDTAASPQPTVPEDILSMESK